MSWAVELAKDCGADFLDGIHDDGSHEYFAELWLTQLEAFYHAARAEALREAADFLGFRDLVWSGVDVKASLRAMADREGKE